MSLFLLSTVGYPRGFAHVTFLTKRIGHKAVEELNGIEMMGRPLRANFAADKPTSVSKPAEY